MHTWALKLPCITPELEHVQQHPACPKTWVRLCTDISRVHQDHYYCISCVACTSLKLAHVDIDLYDLERHHVSNGHRRNMTAFLGLAVGPSGFPTAGAPTFCDFLQVWRARNKAADAVGWRGKCQQMRACLYEALRKDRQAFLRRAETIMLIRDESKGLLLVRLMACDVDLNTRVFTLGVTANAGSDAFDIDRATKGLLRGFCTPLADKEPDQPLLEHVANKIEAVCVDSASNELKAGRLMKETFAPNMKAVIRDRAHATRRLLSRPWVAEPELEDVAHVFVMGRHSLCQRIHHSPEFLW